jgi:ribonuclease HI
VVVGNIPCFLTRVVGLRGVIVNLGGTTKYTYALSLRISSNNQAEAYALLQGLNLVSFLHTLFFIMVGDSRNVNSHMDLGTNPLDFRLASVFVRMNPIPSVKFSHVLWENNYLVDQYANKETLEKEGIIVINDNVYHQQFHDYAFQFA